MSHFKIAMACGCATLSLAQAHMAMAQTARDTPATASPDAPTASPRSNLQIGEIVVTANRRAESVQKTALAVTAISGADLQKLGVTSARDITQLVPNLSIGQTGAGARVAMRGIVSNNDYETGDPAVAFNVNGVYLGRQRSAMSALFDVERIEALRGPQGTLQGRNAAAGSINIITHAPDLDKQSFSGSVGFGNYNSLDANGAINLPVTDTFAMRAAFLVSRHDGYVDSAPAPRNYDDKDTKALRLSLLWKPTDTVTAKFIYERENDGGVGQGGVAGGGPLGYYMTSSGQSPYRWNVRPTVPFTNENINGATLEVTWKTPIVDVTYLGNVRRDNWYTSGAESAFGPLASRCQTVALIPTNAATECMNISAKSTSLQNSHELRFNKNTDKIKAVFGLYYFNESMTSFTGLDPAPGGPTATPWTTVFAFDYPYVREDSRAVFGQVTYSVTDKFRLTAGGRYTRDHKARTGNQYIAAPAGSVVNFQCVNCANTAVFVIPQYANNAWEKPTWKVAADYDLGRASMLYASVSTGYKAGGYGDGSPPFNNPYNPETLTNYEIGSKNRFFGGRLQVNLDLFHTVYSNYQATSGVTDPSNGSIAGVTVNAGKAKIDGIELETVAKLSRYDTLSVSGSLLNARFTDFYLPLGDQYVPGGPCATCGYSLAGNKLPYASTFSSHIAFDHVIPLGGERSITLRADTEIKSGYFVEYHDFDAEHQGAYHKTGLAVIYQHNKAWSVSGYVKNLENKAVLIKGDPDNGAPNGDFRHYGKQGFWEAPRTYGVTITANY